MKILKKKFKFAKTMQDMPHFYIVFENLSEEEKKEFIFLKDFINKNWYKRKFWKTT